MISSDKISIQYYTNMGDEREIQSWMFKEDFFQHIVPIYGRRYEKVSCILEPTNIEFETILKEIFPIRENYNNNFREVMLKAIQFIANCLVYDGRVIFELVKLEDENKKVFYKFYTVRGKEVKMENGKVFQTIHDDAANEIELEQPIIIPLEKCFVIDFPKSLGGKKQYLEFLKDFKLLGAQSPLLNYFENPLINQIGYDRMEHQKQYELELWRKSKTFNWHHRSGNNKMFSGYYYIYRRLNFKKSQIILRDFIISELKNIVSELSKKFGTDSKLKIEGLISIEKIDEKIKQWETGELNPNNISEAL